MALWAAWQEQGTMAYTVSELAGVSKEWARRVLNELEAEGLMKVRQFTQAKLYILTDKGMAKFKEGQKGAKGS